MRGMHKNWRTLGPPADLPDMRSDPLLRRFAKPACDEARAGERTSGDRLGPAGRTLVVLLSGRRVRSILTRNSEPVSRGPVLDLRGGSDGFRGVCRATESDRGV